MKINCEIVSHHFAWKLKLTNLATLVIRTHKNRVVNEFYKILWIVETIADGKFKVVSKNKYFRRKYKLTSNTYRKWCFWYIYKFKRSDEKKNKGEKITVSLEKLKCAKTDSPTCKLYWLTHRQIENLQWITSWKISVEQAFHTQI